MAQAIVRSVLLQSRYRVIDFGVEKTVRELASLPFEAFDAIRRTGLNGKEAKIRDDYRALSVMLDFVVIDPAQTVMSLVEVKYRTKLDDVKARKKDGLLDSLVRQARRFGESLRKAFRGGTIYLDASAALF